MDNIELCRGKPDTRMTLEYLVWRHEQENMSEKIASFKDLIVYQKAFQLQQCVFEASKHFPREERYSLSDQLRRSSRSIGANIAEAWQKRRYPAHFVSKLSDAAGEQAETEHWIESAFSCAYVDVTKRGQLSEMCQEIGRMLGTMMANPDKWCKSRD